MQDNAELASLPPDVEAIRQAVRGSMSTEEYWRTYRKMDHALPFPKQQELMDLGATCRERLLRAGNQSGKTWCACLELVFHLTGLYPRTWRGRRYPTAIKAMIASETTTVLRDVGQTMLFGDPGSKESLGTGLAPLDLIGKISTGQGIRDLYDTVRIKHVSGDYSILYLRSFAAGREAFQGLTLDFVVLDEEPPADVYTEALTRTSARPLGAVLMIFTAMRGAGEITQRFLEGDHPDRGMVIMSLYDNVGHEHSHMTLDQVKMIERSLPSHEVQARVYGGIAQGEGAVFDIPEDAIKIQPFRNIPLHWRKIWGLDFGIGHPAAGALLAHDADTDTVYLIDVWRIKGALPVIHARRMKQVAAGVPVAYPKDGDNRSTGDGIQLIKHYRDEDLRVLPHYATWQDTSEKKNDVSTERGIMEMRDRMHTGRFKAFATCVEFFEEMRGYHRKDGLIVPMYNDTIDAVRVGIMSLRFAKPVPLGGKAPPKQSNRDLNTDEAIRERCNFDLFA
jgi:phage terminase large subunit-like protein